MTEYQTRAFAIAIDLPCDRSRRGFFRKLGPQRIGVPRNVLASAHLAGARLFYVWSEEINDVITLLGNRGLYPVQVEVIAAV